MRIEKKVVQMKFLAMHITNQKLSVDLFTVGNLQNIFMVGLDDMAKIYITIYFLISVDTI